MSRSGRVPKRTLSPDSLYKSRLVTQLINRVMKDGKKDVARKHVYEAFKLVKKRLKKEPLEVFHQALEYVKPSMEVRTRRVGGAAYQVPMPVKGKRRESLAIRWLVLSSRKRPNKEYHTFKEKLAAELMDAFNNQGRAVEKKKEVERVAAANRAFAHFRW